MARKFKDRQLAKIYDLYMITPPTTRLNGFGSAYFNGYDYPDRKDRYVKSSLAYAAWAAGVDQARKERQQNK